MLIVTKVASALIITLVLTFSSCSSWSSSSSSFIYVGCTQQKYEAGSPYEWNLNSVLASIVNSASMTKFNKVKIEEVKGLFQCRGDLSNMECERCVGDAVSRIGTYCVGTCGGGGALQLEGCFVKYDSTSFLGAQDKSVVYSKCGGNNGGGEGADAVAYLGVGGGGQQYFRVGNGNGNGDVQGMVQCVEDLSMEQCGDCLSEAIRRLRTECATSAWGDMFLGKCYARFSLRSPSSSPHHYSKSGDNDETEKTLALIIGLIAAVTLLIVFLSFLSKSLDNKVQHATQMVNEDDLKVYVIWIWPAVFSKINLRWTTFITNWPIGAMKTKVKRRQRFARAPYHFSL